MANTRVTMKLRERWTLAQPSRSSSNAQHIACVMVQMYVCACMRVCAGPLYLTDLYVGRAQAHGYAVHERKLATCSQCRVPCADCWINGRIENILSRIVAKNTTKEWEKAFGEMLSSWRADTVCFVLRTYLFKVNLSGDGSWLACHYFWWSH